MSKPALVDRWFKHIPVRYTLGVFNDNIDIGEVQSRGGIEADVGQDQRPFKEGVSRICWVSISAIAVEG